ncbi:hypothetical protein OG21DRAFT_1487961, partial [Imleria badia]
AINGAILTSAWSAGSSDLYLASRSLYGLAVSGSAPKIFSRTTSSGLPHVAVGVCSFFALLAYLTIKDGPGEVFIWLSDFCSTAGLVTWFGIGVTYLRFYEGLKAQGIDRKTLPFASRVQPYAAWWCVCGSGFSLIFSAWDVFLKRNWPTSTSKMIFVTDYLPIVFFPILYLAAKRFMRVRPVKADDMDFVTNVAEFDAMTYDDPPSKNKLEAFWRWLVRTAIQFPFRARAHPRLFALDVMSCNTPPRQALTFKLLDGLFMMLSCQPYIPRKLLNVNDAIYIPEFDAMKRTAFVACVYDAEHANRYDPPPLWIPEFLAEEDSRSARRVGMTVQGAAYGVPGRSGKGWAGWPSPRGQWLA